MQHNQLTNHTENIRMSRQCCLCVRSASLLLRFSRYAVRPFGWYPVNTGCFPWSRFPALRRIPLRLPHIHESAEGLVLTGFDKRSSLNRPLNCLMNCPTNCLMNYPLNCLMNVPLDSQPNFPAEAWGYYAKGPACEGDGRILQPYSPPLTMVPETACPPLSRFSVYTRPFHS